MSVSRNKKAWTALAAAAASLALVNGCSSKSTDTTATAGSSPTTNGGTGASGQGGSNANAGSATAAGSAGAPLGGAPGTAGVASTAGTAPQAGANSAGGAGGGATAGSGGNGGNAVAGSGGATAAGTGSGGYAGFEPGDTPPPRKLNVTAAPGEHTHGDAGLDNRAKTMLGKLVVDIGVNSGGYVSWLAKRGYHSIGAPCGACAAPNLGGSRDTVGTCRVGEFMNTETSVKSKLASLQQTYPEEDWGYFLNADGSVRWSDVAITGVSHGATTAALAGRIVHRMWRVVSRSGPRDNTCGASGGVCKLPLSTPSYDTNCMPADIASWLDQPPLTPIERFYGIVGTTDVECGDIMFNMHYAKYVGVPTLFNMPDSVLTGTNQFFTTVGGHLDFLNAADKPPNTEAVIDIAFGIPPENQHPTF